MSRDQETQELIKKAGKVREKNFGKDINLYTTGQDYPAISLTGSSCALNCRHCRKKLISRLRPAKTPAELIDACMLLQKKGAVGVLLTGGCDRQGRVQIEGFLPAVRKIKQETSLLVTAHTGIIGYPEAKKIKEAGIDGVCVDVVGSEETTKKVYGIAIPQKRYRETLLSLEKAGIENIAPHVCVGLDYGRLGHEMKALEIIKSIKPSNIVIIGLTDLAGTPMEGIKIDPKDFVKIVCSARLMFPKTCISIGCARGKGRIRAEIDRLSIQAGVNNIAVPTKEAYREAGRLGLAVKEWKACCSLLPSELRWTGDS